MDVLWFILKILLMPLLVALVGAPLFAEYLSFRKDKQDGITHKRFRIFVYSVVFFLVTTVVLVLLKDLLIWIKSWSVMQWLGAKIALSGRTEYVMTVFAVMAMNLAIGVVFCLIGRLVRIGIKKADIVNPKGKDGEYTFLQRIERAVLRFFFHEKWFFAARLVIFIAVMLSVVYSALFILYQIPIFFAADWLPYEFMVTLFDTLYFYPMLVLLPLYEAYYFLEGVRLLEEECPDFLKEAGAATVAGFDAQDVHKRCKETFRNYYRCEFIGPNKDFEMNSTEHHPLTKFVAEGVANSERLPRAVREGYLSGLDVIIRNDLAAMQLKRDEKSSDAEPKGVIVNGGFFTGFSVYFLRYVTAILARGDNVVFVCNGPEQVQSTHEYVKAAFTELYSLYYTGSGLGVSFDDPLWKILAISGDDDDTIDRARLDDCSVLVTDLKYLSSEDFKLRQSDFSQLIDTVVFVDTLDSVTHYDDQMVMFDTAVRNQRELNELRAKNSGENRDDRRCAAGVVRREFLVRYTAKQIKYVCFDDSGTPGLDKVLKNLLGVDFLSADATEYATNAIVACYDYEGRPNDEGERVCPQLVHTDERLGVLVNMADFARSFGAGRVSLFAERGIPYGDVAESLASNANSNPGARLVENTSLFINHPFYDTNDYQVVVAFDAEDNLPMTMRRCAAYVATTEAKVNPAEEKQPAEGEAPEKTPASLMMLFSRPYMLRDYYVENIEQLWKPDRILRVPVEQVVKRSAIRKILVCAATGGITKSELYAIFAECDEAYREMVEADNLTGVLREVLVQCDKPKHGPLLDYFEVDRVRDFDRNGQFNPEERVTLRKTGALYDLIDGHALTQLRLESDTEYISLPRSRITQNYIVGQNMLYNGMVYTIRKMDITRGRIEALHATGGLNNVPYQYIQDREYHIDWRDEVAETIFSEKHVEKGQKDDAFAVGEVYVSVKRRPMEVITKGYTPIDYSTLAKNGTGDTYYVDLSGEEFYDVYRQTYRRYGTIEKPVCPSEVIFADGQDQMASAPRGAMVMSVKLTGNFGENADRVTALAATMLGEILHSMFPSVADSVAVCPVLSDTFGEDADAKRVFDKQYKVQCHGYQPSAKDIELLIIEDCADDLGVISALTTSGSAVTQTLFAPIFKYLDWYTKAENKSTYLYYGLDHEPTCFDFASLHTLSKALGDTDVKMEFVEAEAVVQYNACDFCGKRYPKSEEFVTLEDGRLMCKTCAENLVGNDKKSLKAHLERAKRFLESTYGISLGDDYEVCFESTVKIANALKQKRNLSRRGGDLPLQSYVDDKRKVHIEYSLPSANLSELLVRELTHVWQLKHLPDLEEELAEGHLALVGIQYLRFLGHHTLAAARTTYFESNNGASGIGYRRLVAALLKNPQYRNNPFLYLLDQSGGGTDPQTIIPPTPKPFVEGEYGQPYTPAQPDRILGGEVPYTLRAQLTASQQQAYDIIYAAVCAFEPSVVIGGFSDEALGSLATAVKDDHPELFWYGYPYACGGTVYLDIGAPREEVEVLQRRIEESAARYLEGIDDSMSAYDVTLRLHLRMIGEVDYDSVALEKERKTGGVKRGQIDRLRTIYGVFLDRKAVCAGYAYAMQYLLRKCGIECTQASGMIRKEDGSSAGGHGWVLVKLDGDYYHLDTTWDDSSNTIQTVKNTDPSLDYFAVTTEEITRTRDLSLTPVELPLCTATRCNYFYHNGLVLDSYDMEKVRGWATAAAKTQHKTFAFKCANKSIYDAVFNGLFVTGTDMDTLLKTANKANRKITSCRYNYDPNIWTITVYLLEK